MNDHTDTSSHYPIILAGGGLSAQIMAICLTLSDIPFLWCAGEGKKQTSDLRTTTIHDAGMKMLKALGIAQQCAEALWPITDIQVSDNEAALSRGSRWPLHWHSSDQPLAYVLRNHDLMQACERIAAEGGCSPSPILLKNISAEQREATDSHGNRYRFDLLVICAGGHSPLIQQAGFSVTEQPAGQTALVGTLRSDIPLHHTAYQRFLPSGPFALMPMDRQHYSLVWTLSDTQAQHLAELSPDAQSRCVNDVCGDETGYLEFIEPPQCWKLAPTYLRRIARPGIVLAGDSAHSLHPLAGMGLNLGLADAATLLDCLQHAQRQGLTAAHPSVTSAYQRSRGAEIFALTAATQALNRLFSREQGLLRGWGGLGMSVFGRTALMHPIKQIAMGGRLSQPQLFSGILPH